MTTIRIAIASLVVAGLVGCSHHHKTERVGQIRPAPDELVDNGRGLQGKDVISVSDKMAADLLSIPEINQNPNKLLIVTDRIENKTVSHRYDLSPFLTRVSGRLYDMGHNRVQLLENRDKLRELQSRELDGAAPDRFGQGGTAQPVAPGRIQPDFALWAVITEMPNSETSYYYLEFSLVNLRSGEKIWTGHYDLVTNR